MPLATVKSVVAGTVLARSLYEAVAVRSKVGGCRLSDWLRYHKNAGMSDPFSTYKLHETIGYIVHEQSCEALKGWDDTNTSEITAELVMNESMAKVVRKRDIDQCALELFPSIASPNGRQAASKLTVKEGAVKLLTRYRELPQEYNVGILSSECITTRGMCEHSISAVDEEMVRELAMWLALDRTTSMDAILTHSELILLSTIGVGSSQYEYRGYGTRSDSHSINYERMVDDYKEALLNQVQVTVTKNNLRNTLSKVTKDISVRQQDYVQPYTVTVWENSYKWYDRVQGETLSMCVHARSIAMGRCAASDVGQNNSVMIADTAAKTRDALTGDLVALFVADGKQLALPAPGSASTNSDYAIAGWGSLVASRAAEFRCKLKLNEDIDSRFVEPNTASVYRTDAHYDLAATILNMTNVLIDECIARALTRHNNGVKFVREMKLQQFREDQTLPNDWDSSIEMHKMAMVYLANGKTCDGCAYCMGQLRHAKVTYAGEDKLDNVNGQACVWMTMLPYIQSSDPAHINYLNYFGIPTRATAGFDRGFREWRGEYDDRLFFTITMMQGTKKERTESMRDWTMEA